MRRGLRLLALEAHRGLNDDGHLVHLLALIDRHALPREQPVVVVDRDGSVGASVFGLLRQRAEARRAFELVGVRSSDKARRQPAVYDRIRDELTANVETWLRDGGAIVEDIKLETELHALEWEQQVNGRLKVTPKRKLRKALGRSPDRFDALALSVWEPLSLREALPPPATYEPAANDNYYIESAIDPYAGLDAWRTAS